MAILEKVMQMKEQGMSEDQIVQSLRQEGIPPKDIEESLSQSKIKYAINPESMQNMGEQPQEFRGDQDYSRSSFQEYSEEAPTPEGAEQMQAPSREYFPEYNAQSMYQEYQSPQPFDIETVNEMIEQAIEEKTESLKKEIISFTRFKENTFIELDEIKKRLDKLENIIGELQISILRKLGEYGNDIHSISREMQATQNTFSKIIDPLTDNIRELREISESIKPSSHHPQERQPEKHQEKPVKRSKDDFESFLR